MKKLLFTILMGVSLSSFGQQKVELEMVIYPYNDYQIDRANNILDDPNFSDVSVKVIKKNLPSPGFPGKPAKVDFYVRNTNILIATIYSDNIPTDTHLLNALNNSKLISSDNIIIKHNPLLLAQ